MDGVVIVLLNLAGGIATFTLMALIQWLTNPTAKVGEAGVRIIEYPLVMKIFVIVCWVLATAGFAMLAYFFPEDPVFMCLVFSGFWLILLLMHLEVFYVRILFIEGGILAKSPWRSDRLVSWEAIKNADFSISMQWYRVHVENEGIIRLSASMSGVETFLEELEERGINVQRAPVH